MSTVLTAPQQSSAKKNIWDSTICMKVALHRPSSRKKVKRGEINTGETDEEWLHVSKDILDSSELNAITTADHSIRKWLVSAGLPGPFKGGFYMFAVGQIEAVEKKLAEFIDEREKLIDAFIEVYPQKVEEAKKNLATLWNPDDYPPVEEIRKSFGIDQQYVSFGVPDNLKSISKKKWDQENAKLKKKWEECGEEITLAMRQQLHVLTDKLAEVLSPKPDGTYPKLYDSTVEKMDEWIDMFKVRNVMDDGELDELCVKAKDLLAGTDLNSVRKGDALDRDKLAAKWKDLAGKVDGLVKDTVSRKIKL